MVWVGCGADLQALQVLGLVDRTLVVGEGAPAVFPIGQALQAVRRQFVEHASAYRTVEHVVGVLRTAKYKGQFHGRGVGHDAIEVGGPAGDDVDRAAACAVDHGRVVAQLVGREHGDFNVAVGALFDQFSQLQGGGMLAVGGVDRVAHFQVELGGVSAGADGGHKAGEKDAGKFHGFVSWLKNGVKKAQSVGSANSWALKTV